MDRSMLESQLAAALVDGDAVEIGTLAGLLARAGAVPAEALLWRADGGALAFAAQLDDATLDALLQRATAVDLDSASEEVSDLLLAIDELCAGDTWCGAGRLADTVDMLVRAVHAWPAPWAPLSDLASAVVVTPLAGDPSRVMWAAVEAASGVANPEQAEDAFLTKRVRAALGLPLRISLTTEFPTRLAAAADIPAPPPWLVLGQGDGWEVALTEEAGHRVLVVSSAVAIDPAFELDGEPQTPAVREGASVVPAYAGAWTVRVGAEVIRFDLDP